MPSGPGQAWKEGWVAALGGHQPRRKSGGTAGGWQPARPLGVTGCNGMLKETELVSVSGGGSVLGLALSPGVRGHRPGRLR